MDKSKVEIADIDIEPGEAGKAQVRFVCGQIGHLHKEGRHITVVILERGCEDGDGRGDVREHGL